MYSLQDRDRRIVSIVMVVEDIDVLGGRFQDWPALGAVGVGTEDTSAPRMIDTGEGGLVKSTVWAIKNTFYIS